MVVLVLTSLVRVVMGCTVCQPRPAKSKGSKGKASKKKNKKKKEEEGGHEEEQFSQAAKCAIRAGKVGRLLLPFCCCCCCSCYGYMCACVRSA